MRLDAVFWLAAPCPPCHKNHPDTTFWMVYDGLPGRLVTSQDFLGSGLASGYKGYFAGSFLGVQEGDSAAQ